MLVLVCGYNISFCVYSVWFGNQLLAPNTPTCTNAIEHIHTESCVCKTVTEICYHDGKKQVRLENLKTYRKVYYAGVVCDAPADLETLSLIKLGQFENTRMISKSLCKPLQSTPKSLDNLIKKS
jgi:hypothetical protein